MQIVIGLFIAITFGFLLLTYVLAAFHIQYLPSPDYVKGVRYYAMLSAAACAMFGFSLFVNAPFDETKESGLKHLIGALASPGFSAVIGYLLVTSTIPLGAAIFSTHEVSITFTVAWPEYVGGKFCNRPIGLASLPMLNDTLCNFPPSFQQQLRSGSRIVVTGRGTSWGLFVRSARVLSEAGMP